MRLLLIPLFFASLSAFADNCPNLKKIKNICMTINERTLDDVPFSNNRYIYQRKILEASCVDIERDNQETINRKVQHMWKTFEPKLICNSLQFDTQNGNLIKYAIHGFFDDFIDDVIVCKVNLNMVDKYDGMTVLDYLQSKMDRVKG
jgi:hypothetical protein